MTALVLKQPERHVLQWFDQQDPRQVWLPSVVAAQRQTRGCSVDLRDTFPSPRSRQRTLKQPFMSTSDVVIRVEGLGKTDVLHHEQSERKPHEAKASRSQASCEHGLRRPVSHGRALWRCPCSAPEGQASNQDKTAFATLVLLKQRKA